VDYRRVTRQSFKLETLIGLGKSSHVYRVKAPDGSELALKLPRAEILEDKVLAERFAQEVSMSITLKHPNIVIGFAGRPEGDGAFLALEYFEEGSLEDRLQKRWISQEQAITCLSQVAEALIWLHHQGIIHQDVKPSNIYVRGETYKLGDFGVTRSPQNPRLFERAGSPFYMAPELLLGQSSSPASDAYSFGVMAFELLTGRRPYVRESLEDLSYAHISEPIPHTKLTNKELDRIIRGLLGKDPATRANLTTFLQVVHPKPDQAPIGRPGPAPMSKPGPAPMSKPAKAKDHQGDNPINKLFGWLKKK
jgi:serine/threonine-protein kinase